MCLVVSFLILIRLTVVAFDGKMYALDDTNGRDFLVWNDPIVKTDDMRNLAREWITDQEVVVEVDEEEEEVAIRSKVGGRWSMIYIW